MAQAEAGFEGGRVAGDPLGASGLIATGNTLFPFPYFSQAGNCGPLFGLGDSVSGPEERELQALEISVVFLGAGKKLVEKG